MATSEELLTQIQDLIARYETLALGRSTLGTYQYSTTTTDADPGAGVFRLNNATIASATALYIDPVDLLGSDLGAWIDTFDDTASAVDGTIVLRSLTAGGAFAIFAVTGPVVTASGYRKLTLIHIASGGTWTNNDRFTWTFLRQGDDGLGYGGTSTTSLAIGTGARTLATQTRMAYQPGARVRLASSAAPTTQWMEGVITAYNSGTGSLTFTSDASAGSGTVASWTVNISGEGAAAAAQAATSATAAAGSATAASTSATNAATSATAAQTARTAAEAAAVGMRMRSARVATTAAITLSGTQTIDGVAVIANDIVLVKDQAAPATNGLYVVAAGAWSRSATADTWAELFGILVAVDEGTAHADTVFMSTANSNGTLGTTAIPFVKFLGAGVYAPVARQIIAGTGLTGGGDLSADRTFALDLSRANTWTGLQTFGAEWATPNLKTVTNQINEHSTNGLGVVAINYTGYNGGTTQWRNTQIFDGKNATIALFDGQNKRLDLSNIGAGSTAGNQSYLQRFTYTETNGVEFSIKTVRVSAGSAHDTAENRLQRRVDESDLSYIGLGSSWIRFGIGSTEFANFDGSGRLGIGTSATPHAMLTLSRNSLKTAPLLTNTDCTVIIEGQDGAPNRIMLESFGSLGYFGFITTGGTKAAPTNTPGGLLGALVGNGWANGNVSGGSAAIRFISGENFTSTAQGAYIELGATSNGNNVRVTSGYSGYQGVGVHGIGLTSHGLQGQATVAANAGVVGISQNGVVYAYLGLNNAQAVYAQGNIVATGTITPSDEGLKENIEDIGDAVTMIKALRLRKFDWKPGSDARTSGLVTDYGLIAQEAKDILPEGFVHTVTAPIPIVVSAVGGVDAVQPPLSLQQQLGTYHAINPALYGVFRCAPFSSF